MPKKARSQRFFRHDYAAARKGGVAFREAVFNWPMVSTAWGVAVVFLLR